MDRNLPTSTPNVIGPAGRPLSKNDLPPPNTKRWVIRRKAEVVDIYQIPLVTFNNPNGLAVRDGNAYSITDRSGDPTPHTPLTGGAGSLNSSTLETSTTDLGTEFTNMIITQRAYSAATRAITTADEMLEDLLRIIR